VPDVTGEGGGQGRRGLSVQQGFERFLALSRLLTLIPVIFLLFDAAGSFIYGADILVRTAHGDIGEPARVGGRLGIFLIVMDTFLVGATLLIAAFGFYELFVLRRERPGHVHWLPNWLVMRDLEDLKARVTSMLILVAAITFVDVLVEAHDERGILFLGLGIAAIIVSLTIFLRFGRRDGAHDATAAPLPADGPVTAAAPAPADGPADWPARPPRPDPHARRTAVAIASLSTLDLRDTSALATDSSTIPIRLVAVLGQVTVLVPPAMHVADSGLTFLGSRSVTGNASAPAPGSPLLVTTGASILGRVKITRAIQQEPQQRGNP
jgi:uncharacterized membrane protein YqhA